MEMKLITPPSGAPISVLELKYYLRLDDSTDHDSYLTSLVHAATDHVQGYLGRKLISQTWELVAGSWDEIRFNEYGNARVLPYGQTQSITHIEYMADGVEQTVDPGNYSLLFPETDGAMVNFNTGYSFPTLDDAGVSVRFVCGYGSQEDIPEAIKSAVKLLSSDLFDGTNNSSAVASLLAPYRLVTF